MDIKFGSIVVVTKGKYAGSIGVFKGYLNSLCIISTATPDDVAFFGGSIYVNKRDIKVLKKMKGRIVKHRNLFKNKFGVIISEPIKDDVKICYGKYGIYNVKVNYLRLAKKIDLAEFLV